MRRMTLLMTIILAGALTLSLQAAEAQAANVEEIKFDLVGHTMGGREKSWKFQSVEQIKELVIKDIHMTEDGKARICTIALRLQASRKTGKYAAEARVEYARTAKGWRIKHIGLLSLEKIE
ncbi:MAG TPA: hypothetical protein VGQ99_23455 [Tepidisphaeraceae bacterium]|nr:hypothetical protein [Tepidisphaeraceae bacterium]